VVATFGLRSPDYHPISAHFKAQSDGGDNYQVRLG